MATDITLKKNPVLQTHLKRFHNDPETNLTGYGVFYGDERMEDGPPLPTGSLRRGDSTGETCINPDVDYLPDSTQLRTTINVKALKAAAGMDPTSTSKTEGLGATSNTANGTIYNFATGNFTSTSGLYPQHDKQYLPEYTDEYRTPKERKERAETMTMTHGTASAMKDSRYQHRG
eukprot:gene7581-735_t